MSIPDQRNDSDKVMRTTDYTEYTDGKIPESSVLVPLRETRPIRKSVVHARLFENRMIGSSASGRGEWEFPTAKNAIGAKLEKALEVRPRGSAGGTGKTAEERTGSAQGSSGME